MPLGKALFIAGLLLCLCGLILMSGAKFSWLGRLPGDIRIERENLSFYFPLGTCLLLSLVLTLLAWLFRK